MVLDLLNLLATLLGIGVIMLTAIILINPDSGYRNKKWNRNQRKSA